LEVELDVGILFNYFEYLELLSVRALRVSCSFARTYLDCLGRDLDA
jgi:hypothetical protein